MIAITKKPFLGVPDGQVHPREYREGDEITGDLAKLAIEAGWASAPENKAAKPPRTKAKE